MCFCINPDCRDRQNIENVEYCQACGTQLLIEARYRLVQPLRPLSEEHLAEVFEVSDRGIPKVLKSLTKNSPKLVELFQREAQVLIGLKHPGIPKVEANGYFTFSPSDSLRELHCLVMEKIEGENLQQWLDLHGAIGLELAFQWLRQLAEILDRVHKKGLFHRDIKPSNIMRRPSGQLVLIDFGTVREVTQTVINRQEVTVVYSYGYTAKEQFNGRAVPQSDFFALGRTFVHLITGKHPGDFSPDAQTEQLLWRDSTLQISAALADFIDELMAPNVQNRPKNTQIILQRLDDLIKPTVVTQVPPHPQSSRLPWVIAALSSSLLANALLWSVKQPIPVTATLQPCVLPATEPPRLKHEDDINALVFSPDGKYLATASSDNTARLWETTTGKQVACLQHKESVVAVAFSPNGKYLAAASLDKIVQVRQMSSGSIISLQHEDSVVAFNFSRDGKYLATASADGNARVWKTTNGRRVATLPHDAFVRSVAFSPDGRYLATASLDNTAQVWDAIAHKQVKLLQHRDRVLAVAFSQDGKYLATGSANGSAQVWEWESRDRAIATHQQNGSVTAVAFSPNEKYLATTATNGTAQMWEWKATSGSKVLSVPQDDVVAVDFSRDGKYLVTGSANGIAQVWDASDFSELAQKQYDKGLVAVAFSLDGQLAAASRDNTIWLWKWKKQRSDDEL